MHCGQSEAATADNIDMWSPGRLRKERIAELESQLERSRTLLRDLVDGSPHAAAVHSEGIVRYANKAAVDMLGAGYAGVVGSRLLDYVEPSCRDAVVERGVRVLRDGAPAAPYETRLVRLDGSILVAETIGGRTEWDGRPAVHVVMWDVSRRHQVEQQLGWSATHDALTGLGNSRLLDERIAAIVREGVPVGLLYLDLDGFKAVNDRFGHDYGDELLRHAGQRLTQAVHEGDVVARLGGDEFVVVLRGVRDESYAAQVGERLRAALSEPFDLRGTRAVVSASCGVALAATPELLADVVTRADQDLLAAKRRRGLRVVR